MRVAARTRKPDGRASQERMLTFRRIDLWLGDGDQLGGIAAGCDFFDAANAWRVPLVFVACFKERPFLGLDAIFEGAGGGGDGFAGGDDLAHVLGHAAAVFLAIWLTGL